MRNFIAGIFVGFMILAMFFFLFEGMATVQEDREYAAITRCDREIASCTTGQHCQVMGRDLLTITSKGAR